MLKDIFKPTTTRSTSYSPYFANKQISENALKVNNQHKYRKYKLITLLLAKSLKRALTGAWKQLWEHSLKTKTALLKMAALSDKNLSLSLFLAFDKLKQAAFSQKAEEKTLKSLVNLLQRI